MIRKSGNRFSEEIMLKQRDKTMIQFNLIGPWSKALGLDVPPALLASADEVGRITLVIAAIHESEFGIFKTYRPLR